MVVRVSMNIFNIFGVVEMLQLSTFLELLQFTLIESYEQRLVKIIYLTSPIFVVVLKFNSNLYQFYGILENVLVL